MKNLLIGIFLLGLSGNSYSYYKAWEMLEDLEGNNTINKLTALKYISGFRDGYSSAVVNLEAQNGRKLKNSLCIPEEVGASGTAKIIRFWEDRMEDPTSTDGIPRGDLEAFEIIGAANIANCRIIRVTASAHKIMVQYYG